MKKIEVIELFAGVGGFRIAFEQANKQAGTNYATVWANQWEPSTKKQHAAEIYEKRFGKVDLLDVDIEKVIEHNFDKIPNHDLLVGGFPCQDYSVAKTLSQSHGLIGKKGVLWWSIYSILERKGKYAPKYIFLENVDRLLKSPASQRGRDFAVMLASLSNLGYAVEWRVVNAAEYGFPQRRRRVFIVAYKHGTKLYQQLAKSGDKQKWLTVDGVFSEAFKVKPEVRKTNEFLLDSDLAKVTSDFSADKPKMSPFENSGVMINKVVVTAKVEPDYDGTYATLGDVLVSEDEVSPEYYINESTLGNWTYLKGAKNEPRQSKSGHQYFYNEGSMIFPDKLSEPSRTIITGEGGSSPSRFKHVIKTNDGRYRRLVPLELERLNMFPDNHTQVDGVSDTKRAFIMGNALVVGAIQKVAESLAKRV